MPARQVMEALTSLNPAMPFDLSGSALAVLCPSSWRVVPKALAAGEMIPQGNLQLPHCQPVLAAMSRASSIAPPPLVNHLVSRRAPCSLRR
jgi:hypothetical protein